jgi:predicted PurR-regulated permease PerM
LWAALVCLAVLQAEAYVVQPLVQRWAVRLPPLSVLIFGLLFGLPGVLLAAPLVLTIALIDHLYVQAVPAIDDAHTP